MSAAFAALSTTTVQGFKLTMESKPELGEGFRNFKQRVNMLVGDKFREAKLKEIWVTAGKNVDKAINLCLDQPNILGGQQIKCDIFYKGSFVDVSDGSFTSGWGEEEFYVAFRSEQDRVTCWNKTLIDNVYNELGPDKNISFYQACKEETPAGAPPSQDNLKETNYFSLRLMAAPSGGYMNIDSLTSIVKHGGVYNLKKSHQENYMAGPSVVKYAKFGVPFSIVGTDHCQAGPPHTIFTLENPQEDVKPEKKQKADLISSAQKEKKVLSKHQRFLKQAKTKIMPVQQRRLKSHHRDMTDEALTAWFESNEGEQDLAKIFRMFGRMHFERCHFLTAAKKIERLARKNYGQEEMTDEELTSFFLSQPKQDDWHTSFSAFMEWYSKKMFTHFRKFGFYTGRQWNDGELKRFVHRFDKDYTTAFDSLAVTLLEAQSLLQLSKEELIAKIEEKATTLAVTGRDRVSVPFDKNSEIVKGKLRTHIFLFEEGALKFKVEHRHWKNGTWEHEKKHDPHNFKVEHLKAILVEMGCIAHE